MDQQQCHAAPIAADNKQMALKAITIYCLVFIGGLIAVTAALPRDIAGFISHLGFVLPFVYDMAGKNYSRYIEQRKRNALFNAAYIIACMATYYVGQRLVNGTYPAPEHYFGPELVFPAILVTAVAVTALLIVRRFVWRGFHFQL
ncbi:hypothetical protein NPS53_08150 [Pseudomonas putida]|uniref:hypothetical protein n=1 Tax=Pseudomonas putida TaxID=303 RepID=UPI0023638929|nr:hypothetical protein [Pseudomonas putida]MDD2139542.1 hypothetical protein [Pseudomonas putida]HDS1721465.1 hypothetical protein [Pseudomonas putida]